MMKYKLCLFLLLWLSQNIYAQKIFSTDHEYQADIKVAVVEHAYQADLIVYRIEHPYQAEKNNGVPIVSSGCIEIRYLKFAISDYT